MLNLKNKKKGLIIIGAGGHGRSVADVAVKMDKWDNIYFMDDCEDVKESMGISLIGTTSSVDKCINDYEFIVGIGDCHTRKLKQHELEKMGADIPVLIHPNAIIGTDVLIGAGSVIMAGAIINCCSKIGSGCIINTASTIDHDNIIGDFVHVSPGVLIAGTVKIGDTTWLGIGSVIVNNINITDDCLIGAGAVVTKDINKSGVYIGVPARRNNHI